MNLILSTQRKQIVMQIKLAFLLMFISSSIYGENGYVYEGDLNGDGIPDKITSGPSGQFGNAGGPFMISISSKDGTFKSKVLGFHPRAIALEKTSSGNYLWGYWRYSSSLGDLFYITLDGQFIKTKIGIRAGSNSELGSSIYNTIFDAKNEYIVKLKKVDNYVPVEYPWGKG